MDYITLLGLLAGICTTFFFPQIAKIIQTKQTRDLSLPMFVILSIGVLLWIIYGILSKSLPVVLANAVVFLLCIYIMSMKLKYG